MGGDGMSDIRPLLTRLRQYVPSHLADQIAADVQDSLWLAQHDQALREQIAGEIEASDVLGGPEWVDGMIYAARIARGDS
jgi:hypothetical protein